MSIVLAAVIALQTASIPPPPPEDPGPERRAAAVALFDRDPYISEYSWGISIAASRLAGDVLTERKLNAYDRDVRLADRLSARAKAASAQIIDEAVRCVAEPMAQRLYVNDLTAFKAFAASPEGRRFWDYYFRSLPWYDCFRRPVRAYLDPFVAEDLAIVIAETPIR